MILRTWLNELDYELVRGSLDAEVTEVVYDSRKAVPGAVFVCMAGTRVDSHCFVPDVLRAGVRVLVTERDVEEELAASGLTEDEMGRVTILKTAEGRKSLALLSAARFGYPATGMITIGVTGTKGKTTTTHMIKAILEAAGKKVGMIGTTGTVINGQVTPTMNTTPESYELHQSFAKMAEAGCQYMIMEVSSQGIKMHRVDGISFDYGIFTNISPDHIGPDEHADFAEYLYCKSRLLNMCRIGLVNLNDGHFKEIVKDASCRLYTYRVKEDRETKADFEAQSLTSQENWTWTSAWESPACLTWTMPWQPCAYAPFWDFQKRGLSTPWSTYVSMDAWKSSTPHPGARSWWTMPITR